MARPERHDVDYFPFYVKDGKTLFILESKYGCKGTGFFTNVMRFLCLQPDHHICIEKLSDRLFFFAKTKCDEESGMDMLNLMSETGKITREMWVSHKVIVSEALLDSLKDAYRHRVNKIITIDRIIVSYGGNSVTNGRNTHGPDVSNVNKPQTKLKETKLKEYIYASNHPTIEQVRAYCLERKNHVDPQQWLDHYTSNGWMVGRNKMKDWKAAVRTWERTGFERGNGKRQATQPQQRDPFIACIKCGEEYLETDLIDINGSFYCPKCPEARAAYSGGGDRVRGLVSGIGRSIGDE